MIKAFVSHTTLRWRAWLHAVGWLRLGFVKEKRYITGAIWILLILPDIDIDSGVKVKKKDHVLTMTGN